MLTSNALRCPFLLSARETLSADLPSANICTGASWNGVDSEFQGQSQVRFWKGEAKRNEISLQGQCHPSLGPHLPNIFLKIVFMCVKDSQPPSVIVQILVQFICVTKDCDLMFSYIWKGNFSVCECLGYLTKPAKPGHPGAYFLNAMVQ